VHEKGSDRAVISEGRPTLAFPENGSPFSPDGKKLHYLQLARPVNEVGADMLAPYAAGELWVVDLENGQTQVAFPGLNIASSAIASDGDRIALSDSDRLWVATLDGRGAPRQLPVGSAQFPRWSGDYIYFVSGSPPAIRTVRRIRPDGSGEESVWSNDVWRAAMSPDGQHLALVIRASGETSGPAFQLNIVDWHTGHSTPVCTNCSGMWSDNGEWFAIAELSGSGERGGSGTYLLPTRRETGVPDVPSGGFATLRCNRRDVLI
jgi:Tol biopolymer transport system component